MEGCVSCCQDPATLVSCPTPFTRMLALGFYDGATSGVLQCGTCGAVYKFDMLDWSEDHDIRILRLAPLPADTLDKCLAAHEGDP